MSVALYRLMPKELTLREVRVHVRQQGFRTRTLLIVTTLLHAERFSAEAIAQLYRRRWQAELNLRSLKVTLQMDHLRSKTPEAARKEIYMHLTAYNLIRQVMAQAALAAEREPWTVSFKGAVQALLRFLPLLETRLSSRVWSEELLKAIAAYEVGNRPDRVEPRVKKRRPKEYDLMNRPRNEYLRITHTKS